MSSPDRLDELLRQRALVREHLDWIDREVAREESGGRQAVKPRDAADIETPPGQSATAAGQTAADAESSATSAKADDTDPDAIMESYRVASADLQRDLRKGCLFYVVIGFVLLCAAIAALYFALRR